MKMFLFVLSAVCVSFAQAQASDQTPSQVYESLVKAEKDAAMDIEMSQRIQDAKQVLIDMGQNPNDFKAETKDGDVYLLSDRLSCQLQYESYIGFFNRIVRSESLLYPTLNCKDVSKF